MDVIRPLTWKERSASLASIVPDRFIASLLELLQGILHPASSTTGIKVISQNLAVRIGVTPSLAMKRRFNAFTTEKLPL